MILLIITVDVIYIASEKIKAWFYAAEVTLTEEPPFTPCLNVSRTTWEGI